MRRRTTLLLALVMIWLALPSGAGAVQSIYLREEIPEQLSLIHITESIYQVRGTRRLVENCADYGTEQLAERVKNYNAVLDQIRPHIPVYLYFVENSRSHPMQKEFSVDSDAYLYLKKNFHADKIDHLKYTTFEEYCQYFYTTDHHWNFAGSYQGYQDVVRMLKGKKEKTLRPSALAVMPYYFNGHYCQLLRITFSKEYFAIYKFNYPAYTAYINDKRKLYDRIDLYLSGNISDKLLFNHYSCCYGGDFGKIVFEGTSEKKGTLLLFGDSMSNPVKTLLMQHYGRIIYIDLRHYEADVGRPFSMQEILAEFQVDQILFLGNVTLFNSGDLMYP